MADVKMMAALAEIRVSVPADVLLRELDGESVILNLKTESYFGLDKMGTLMWQLLTESASVQDAYDRLLGEYEVSPENLERDLRKLIEDLRAQGLIEVTGA